MVLIEWLIEVDKIILEEKNSAEVIKSLNGGYIKVIKEEKDKVTIAIPKDPEKIKLPSSIRRKKVKNNPSCYERWGLRKQKGEN